MCVNISNQMIVFQPFLMMEMNLNEHRSNYRRTDHVGMLYFELWIKLKNENEKNF